MRRDFVNFRDSKLAAIALAVLCFATVRPAAAQTTYTVTDLGTLGGTISQPFAVSPQGWVTGVSTLPNGIAHAFRWRNGIMTDLGTLGGDYSVGFGINVWTRVVGHTLNESNENRAFLYVFGTMQDLGTLGGGNSVASAINIRNWVVGRAESSSIDLHTGRPQVHAFLWIKGTPISDLGTLGGANSEALGINVWGKIVGSADTTFTVDPSLGFAPFHAALWSNGTQTDLGTLGGKLSIGVDINKLGQAVGVSTLAGESTAHAFLSQGSSMVDLGTLAGDTASIAFSINDSGQVVGASSIGGFSAGVIWTYGSTANCHLQNFIVVCTPGSLGWRITELNLLTPANSLWFIISAEAINRFGQIACEAVNTKSGEIHGVLLTPATSGTTAMLRRTPLTRTQPKVRPRVTIPENVRKILEEQRAGSLWLPGRNMLLSK
jgi:probable HAF family extracellular repeat protein